jgi:hypothetical protein
MTSANPPPPPAFTGGLISAQYANLRFGSGLTNRSTVAFTAGTNTISGRVINNVDDEADEPDGDFDDTTVKMVVSGHGTSAVFNDSLSFAASTALSLQSGGNVSVLNTHSFTLAGILDINLSYTNPSLINVNGDVGIGGFSDLKVSLDSDALHSLKHGDAFKIISFGGFIGNVNLTTDPNDPVPDLTQLPKFTSIETSPNVKTLYGLDTVVEFANSAV